MNFVKKVFNLTLIISWLGNYNGVLYDFTSVRSFCIYNNKLKTWTEQEIFNFEH